MKTREATGRNGLEGLVCGRAGTSSRKPSDAVEKANAALVRGNIAFLPGEIGQAWRCRAEPCFRSGQNGISEARALRRAARRGERAGNERECGVARQGAVH